MIQIDNITLRNLEEQVLRNTSLLNLLPNGITGTQFKGIYANINYVTGEDRDIVLIGDSAPYTMYIKWQGEWKNLGKFPAEGPRGKDGIIGAAGPKGEPGIGWITGSSEPTLSAPLTTLYLNFTNGDVFQYTPSGW